MRNPFKIIVKMKAKRHNFLKKLWSSNMINKTQRNKNQSHILCNRYDIRLMHLFRKAVQIENTCTLFYVLEVFLGFFR